jgi:hypothetical protein
MRFRAKLERATHGSRAKSAAARDIEYSAPDGCIDRAAFVSRLASLPRAPTALTPPRSVAITIRSAGATYAGTLHLVDADGAAIDREVVGSTCDDVAEALLLVTAVGMGLEPPAHDAAPAIAPEVPPASTSPAASSAPPPARSAAAGPPDRSPWHVSAGLDAATASVLGPGPPLGAASFIAVDRDGAVFAGPELRLSAFIMQSGTVTTNVGTATLSLRAVALEVCPLRFALGPRAALRPCAGAQVGTLEGAGEGSMLTQPRSASFPWYGTSAVARIDATFMRILLVEAGAGAIVPLRHDSFYFGPTTTIYAVPAAGAVANAGLGVRFP